MRRVIAAGVVLVGLALAGCGGADVRDGLVVKGTPPATPYTGPLHLPSEKKSGDGEPEPGEGSGAAGKALECDGAIFSGGGSDRWSKGDGGSTPEEGLNAYFDIYVPEEPDYGYRVERREGDRVLFSFDVRGRTKVAVVVAKDQPHRPGWGPETSASCDPSEWPASYARSKGYEIWADRTGHRVPTTKVSSSPGAEHCDWQSAHFLDLGSGPNSRQYVRDPEGLFDSGLLKGTYDADTRMPADARDTGYHYRDWTLWLAADRSTAYVRTSDGVEAWPAAARPIGCD
ncbi:hypothetical protein OOK06_25050 [Streptomyces sp. NBC_00340]|uniref:hypothetical protein n=1 Tax=Streptomyces sp. NBC_00340 TaxID=2975716 RepID=UPI00224F6DD6|nr:hypothetical protein [Streptomyces sp. NBC_00340]MCX5135337.1 hypothetical protein [Streptomyces sp. NBC_00340]